jgi:hypothetical protein
MFYLSPALKISQFKKLQTALIAYIDALKLMWQKSEDTAVLSEENLSETGACQSVNQSVDQSPAPVVFEKDGEIEWVEFSEAKGRVCAKVCGLFPPCMPLILDGEVITEKKLLLLEKADNLFGVKWLSVLDRDLIDPKDVFIYAPTDNNTLGDFVTHQDARLFTKVEEDHCLTFSANQYGGMNFANPDAVFKVTFNGAEDVQDWETKVTA